MSMVEITKPGGKLGGLVGKKGSSDVATMKASFPTTPSLVDYTNAAVGQLMVTMTHGLQNQNPDFAGNKAPNLDFSGNNDITSDQNGVGGFGGGGKPASPWAPAVGSPGVGLDAKLIPAPPAGFGTVGSELDSKAGSITNPLDSSKKVATQQASGNDPSTKITGNLTLGASFPGSNNG